MSGVGDGKSGAMHGGQARMSGSMGGEVSEEDACVRTAPTMVWRSAPVNIGTHGTCSGTK